jgi:small subunit ribosomal protein S6
MKKYEAMFIIKPDLSEDEKKALFTQIEDAVVKNNGKVLQANVWSERKKLYFPMKKQHEGIYYLVNFNVPPEAAVKIRQAYKLNEGILRFLITKIE